MIRIKKETANVWEHTNGNIATIANVVDLWKPRFIASGPMCINPIHLLLLDQSSLIVVFVTISVSSIFQRIPCDYLQEVVDFFLFVLLHVFVFFHILFWMGIHLFSVVLMRGLILTTGGVSGGFSSSSFTQMAWQMVVARRFVGTLFYGNLQRSLHAIHQKVEWWFFCFNHSNAIDWNPLRQEDIQCN